MLMASLILTGSASLILAICLCFANKNKTLALFLRACMLVALTFTAIVCANFKNNFSGYAVFLILSIVPQFLSLIDLEAVLSERKKAIESEETTKNEVENINELANEENIKTTPKEKKHYLLKSNGSLLKSATLLLTAICIGFAAFYVGKETPFGFILGLLIALCLTFLTLIFKKTKNPFDILSIFVAFLSIGIVLGQIVCVLSYAQTSGNILFAIGSVCFCSYCVINTFIKFQYSHLIYVLSVAVLLSTLIF